MPANDKTMIKHLNTILKNELTAINQYFLHAKILIHSGYKTLGDKEYEESIDEMKHADELAQRILFLGGLPNFQELGRLTIGETPAEMMQVDFDMEAAAIKDLREAVAYADSINDYGTVECLTAILTSEEEHYTWLEQQLGLIKDLGEQNWLQTQV